MLHALTAVGSGLLVKASRKKKKLDGTSQHVGTTIFVCMPVFRTPEPAAKTLADMFENSRVPSRIRVGCIYHAAISDDDIIDIYKEIATTQFIDRINVIRHEYKHAQGAQHARLQSIKYLFNDESHILFVDCHTAFVTDWDEILLSQLQSLPPKAIITTIPPQMTEIHSVDTDQAPNFPFIQPRIYKMSSTLVSKSATKKALEPFPSPFFCACFAFAKAADIAILPGAASTQEGQLDVLHTALLLDRGHAFYVPPYNVVAQDWNSYGRPVSSTSTEVKGLMVKASVNFEKLRKSVGYDFLLDEIVDDRCLHGLTQNAGERECDTKCGASFTLQKKEIDLTLFPLL